MNSTLARLTHAERLHASLCALPCRFSNSVRSKVASSVVPASQARIATITRAAGESPFRSAISGAVSNIYKVSAALSPAEPGLSPLWTGVKKLSAVDVQAALGQGADINERNAEGDTPLLYIARQGHYKYPPADIPTALVKAGADLEAQDSKGLTALQVSLLAGWQNIAELLIKSKAQTSGVAAIKGRVTCPDCKRVIANYAL